MKKFICITIASLCVLALIAGCGGGNQQQSPATTQISGNSSQPSGQSSQGGQSSSGGSGGQSSGGQSIEPKQLISKQEAAQLLGEAVKDAVTSDKTEMGLKTCFYVAENTTSKGYLEIAVMQSSSGQGGQSGQKSGGSSPSSSPSGGQSSGGQSGGSQSGGGQGQMSPNVIYEALKKVMADPNSTEAIRIGDEAFATAAGITILSKQYCIFVSASGADPATAKELTKKAGELAMSNLERIQGSSKQ